MLCDGTRDRATLAKEVAAPGSGASSFQIDYALAMLARFALLEPEAAR
jgi:hypothetical protein